MAPAHPELVAARQIHEARLEVARCGKVRFGTSASPTLDLRPQYADVAQLVARNLAKVQVAGSNPVVRSDLKSLSIDLHL